MIYFIECQGAVKIGFSKNPRHRLVKLATDSPFPCSLMGVVEGCIKVERALHIKFSEFRIRGEWFKFTREIDIFIQQNTIPYPKAFRQPIAGFGPLGTWRVETDKSVTDAAKAAGVTPAMWSRWENNKRLVPAERAVKLEDAIGVSRHDMRPDIFGPKPSNAA